MNWKTLLFLLAAAVALGLAGTQQAQNFLHERPELPTPPGGDDDYASQWRAIDSLERLGLPKSAYAIAEEIYKDAQAQQDHDQTLKAFIFRMKFLVAFEENAFEDGLAELEAEWPQAHPPVKAMMRHMLARLYWDYYQMNQWQFADRTNTVGFDKLDIQTWTNTDLARQVTRHHLGALEQPALLQGLSTADFEAVISGRDTEQLRPTLYDFVAHQAIDFFANSTVNIDRPADVFALSGEAFFAPAEQFARLDLQSTDSLSFHFHAIRILRDLVAFRLTQPERLEALVDADLKRLAFVHDHSTHPRRDSLYRQALESLASRHAAEPASAQANHQLARLLVRLSEQYSPTDPRTEPLRLARRQALDLCRKTQADFPQSYGASLCGQLESELLGTSLSIEAEANIGSERPFATLLNYKNIDSAYWQVARIEEADYNSILQSNTYGEQRYDKLREKAKVVASGSQNLADDPDLRAHNTELLLQSPKQPGLYLLLVADNSQFGYQGHWTNYLIFRVTDLSYIIQQQTDGSLEIFVRDRTSGEALSGVEVEAWYWDYTVGRDRRRSHSKRNTDNQGHARIEPSGDDYLDLHLDFRKGEDFYNTDGGYYTYRAREARSTTTATQFFLDRAIYRPGQTVFFKGIAIESKGDERKLLTNRQSTVRLRDVNGQELEAMSVTTNEYGSFHGQFILPTGGLTGSFSLQVEDGSISFQVEEYKRPTFEAKLLPFEGTARLNETLSVRGQATAYAGSNITGAKVSYRVYRKEYRWGGWWWPGNSSSVEVANGTTETDANGGFAIEFVALPDMAELQRPDMAYTYTLSADITDLNGETRTATSSITLGYTDLVAKAEMPEQIDADAPNRFALTTQNLNGQFKPASGTLKVFRLQAPDNIPRARLWAAPDRPTFSFDEWRQRFPDNVLADENILRNWPKGEMVFDQAFDTQRDKEFELRGMAGLEPGAYVLELEARDQQGNRVSHSQFFTLFEDDKDKLPYPTPFLSQAIVATGQPGEKARFLVGTSYPDARVLFEVEHDGKVVRSEWLTLDAEQRVVEIPIEEKHRGNFSVAFTLVRDNRLYSQSHTVTVPYSNKELDIEFSTFRDKLLPGEEEEWRLVVKGNEGQKVMAEMVATLYDVSLDQFAANHWSMSLYPYRGQRLSWRSSSFGARSGTTVANKVNLLRHARARDYQSFNWHGFSYQNYRWNSPVYRRSMSGGAMPAMAPDLYDMDVNLMDVELEEAESPGEPSPVEKIAGDEDIAQQTATAEPNAPEAPEATEGQPQVRTNFNETAFFFPDLRTDAEGNLVIRFTMPESLTRWKMLGLAHTQDLSVGTVTNQLITQKELMVMPNLPRFFRENDEMVVPVKIANLTEAELQGSATLEFFDAISLRPYAAVLQEGAEKRFSVEAGQNALLEWKVKIPEGAGALSYRVVATAADHSDGQQMVVPVLTNRMLVTESLPLPVRGQGTQTFRFDKLLASGSSSTLRHEKLTLEFTSNPAWYAVQALPYLMEYPHECAEQLFSRYYANALASHVANSSPLVKRVFDAWAAAPDAEALLSNLEKNQELKALLLEETPWLLNAQDETQRKRRVALLFDLNRMANELGTAMAKLQRMQYASGAWPWFPGMPESRHITQHVVTGMGQLDHLGVRAVRDDAQSWAMVQKAVGFLDQQIADDYQWLKRNVEPEDMDDDHLSQIAIHYLYARSFFRDLPIPSASSEAVAYYTAQAQRYWLARGKYLQGMIALALHRAGQTEAPAQIVNSLRENSTTDDEMGMYWLDNRPGYYWYESPIETQALLIEVFDEVADDQQSVNDLKVWLLKQKQTQDWGNTRATVEAVYALLLRDANWLENDAPATVVVGGQTVQPEQAEAGTGYFKTSWNAQQIRPEMGQVSVTNHHDGVAWGALYWQYFEQLDKITPHATPLSLAKQLFVVRNSPSGPVMEPIRDGQRLQVGDLVRVRVEIRSDRDMEYVHLKDMRASGFEPVDVISAYRFQGGLGYYQSTRDASTNFFIGWLPKGTHVFEYDLRVTHKGDFSNGITSLQCMYAPEFTTHSAGIRVQVR